MLQKIYSNQYTTQLESLFWASNSKYRRQDMKGSGFQDGCKSNNRGTSLICLPEDAEQARNTRLQGQHQIQIILMSVLT